MARGWRVLDATAFNGRISTRRGQLRFASFDFEDRFVPVADIAVLLIGVDTTITSGVLSYLAEHDVAALICDWRGVPKAGLFPWLEHTRTGARHLAQSSVSLPRRKNAWMQLVRAKIHGQAATLAAVNESASARLREMAATVRSGDRSNAEASAARWYWRNLFGDRTFIRDTNGLDATNSLLNYGYGILRGFGIRAVTSAGLSPAIGLFHRNRSKFFNLVDDVIEPFRPAVDSAVLSIGPEANLKASAVKAALVSAASQRFSADGQRIPGALEDLAQQLGRYVEGDVDRLTVASWNGPIAEVADVSGA